MSFGDPTRTRVKVYKYDGRWRVFELAQPGQHVSWISDLKFETWEQAFKHGFKAATQERMYAFLYGRNRHLWPSTG